MFKSAATKIAHNSTLPSLALSGNKDLRPLQDLITAEKVALMSLQKLSVDFTKASEALRVWGAGEGEDLGDILGASTTILAHFAAALSGYATREHGIRDYLKQIRTREEALDELKRRRKATLARADSAEKKLNKMGPEHKNLAQQTDVLGQLQAQIRAMDNEIMNEEAALGDFKRSSARALMGLKFGGLMECCEKGCVAADVGRAVVAEISEEATPPGLARSVYMGHQQTQQRVAEAERGVNEVVFSALPTDAGPPAPPRINTNFGADEFGGTDNAYGGVGGAFGSVNSMGGVGMGMQNTGTTGFSGMGGISMQNTGASAVGSTFDYNATPNPNAGAGSGFLPPPPDVGGGLMDAGRDGASVGGVSPGGSYINSTSNSSYQPPPAMTSPGGFASSQGGYNPPEGLPPGAGVGTGPISGAGYTYPGATPQEELWNPTEDPILPLSSTGLGINGGTEGPKGGKFATFPVRGRGYSLRDESGTAQSESAFASSVGGTGGGEGPPSLGATRRKDTSGSDFMAAVLDAGEFGGGRSREAPPPMPTQPAGVGIGSAFSSKQQERDRERERARQEEMEEAAPEYRDYEPTSHSQVPYQPYAASGPPPGAAPPVVGGVWMGGGELREEAQGNTLRAPGTPSLSVEEEGGGDRRSTTLSEDISLAYMSIGIDEPPPIEGEGEKERQARLSKHVRFGDDSVFEEQAPEPPYMKRKESSSSIGTGRSRRVAPPSISPVEDERALNAAAAREVSRELDALNFSPPPPAPQVQVQDDGEWEFANTSPSREGSRVGGSPPKARGDYQVSSPKQYNPPLPSPINNANQYVAPLPPPNREPSPLIPPAAPFSRKATLDTTVAPGGLAGIGAGHQNTPSWDGATSPGSGPVQPAPFTPGHHTTPSWALSPASDGPGSPISGSPRLETPYRAPTANRSTSSLNTQVPPGTRTISAAAFRRPIKTASSSDLADTSPLALKKRLPASPYPQARTTGSGLREASPQPQQPPPQQQQHQEDDSYDYISAYTNGGRDSQAFRDDGAGSPMAADFDYGRLGKVGVVGGPPTSPGYSEGRFATDLDPDGLR